jgi:hypothetical protein
VILAGDHIYKMDYEVMLRQHVETGADVTVGCLTVPRMEAVAFGVMHVDAQNRITDFLENPPTRRRSPAIPTMRWPRWGSTSSPGPSCATSDPRCRGPEFHPRFRRRPDPAHRQERQGDGAPVRGKLRHLGP